MAAGHQYYLENQNELQKFTLIDDTPQDYPKYIKRPTLGCRALVKRSLQVLNPILHEMEDWKDDVRLHSTKLLMQIVIHCEDHLATKYFDINAVLCKTCNDQDTVVAKQALEVAKLVGHFVDAKTWTKYAFEELKIRQNKQGVLKCINALYEHSNDAGRFDNLQELSEILLDSSICHSDKESQQAELLKLLEIVIPGISDDYEKLIENFYIVSLKSTAVSFDNETVKSSGTFVLSQLASKSKTDISDMHEKFLKSALDTLDLLDKPNDDSEQVAILYGIICLSGFQVANTKKIDFRLLLRRHCPHDENLFFLLIQQKSFIGELKRVIIAALEHCEAEGKIKIFSGIAMVSHDDNFIFLFFAFSHEKS